MSHASSGVVVYDPKNGKARSGSGLLSGGGGTTYTEGLARPSNVIEARAEGAQGQHSAPFPVAIPEFFIKAFTDPGDVVFDPFLGSGSTMIAAIKNGRSCYGCELSPNYTDVIVARAQKAVSEQFRLEGDGRTFAEMREERLGVMA